ncbi:MAG: dUTP diphosphatase [Candidatus Poseidoniaceae archaeon]
MFSTGDFLTQNQCTQPHYFDIYHFEKTTLNTKKTHLQPKGIDITLAVECNMRQNVEVLFAKLEPDAAAPTQGSKSAAGWDLRALEDTTVMKGVSTKIRTGLAVAIPEGWEGQIRSRSSLGAKGMIMPNGVGTIDSDYRGELMVLATWIGEGDSIHLSKGERIAQMLIAPVPNTTYREVGIEDLSKTERGKGGFGSSGKF